MLRLFSWILVSLTLSGFLGCKEEDTPEVSGTGIFELNLVSRVSGSPFYKEVVFENVNGRSFYVERFQLYLSDIALINQDGTERLLSEIELMDLTEPGSNKIQHGEGTYRQYEVPTGDYAGVKFGIGVKPELNHEDPAGFPQDHPLHVFNQMNWNWASGYRFVVIEGRIDSSANKEGASFEHPFVYHTGLDTLYRPMVYDQPDHRFTVMPGEEAQFVLELDLNRLFYNATDTLDMVADNISHTMPPGSPEYFIAKFITDNLANNALFKLGF